MPTRCKTTSTTRFWRPRIEVVLDGLQLLVWRDSLGLSYLLYCRVWCLLFSARLMEDTNVWQMCWFPVQPLTCGDGPG